MKKLLSVLVCFAMLMSNAAFAISPAVTEVESAEESVQTEQDSRQAEEQETADIDLYAVWEKNPADPVLRWTFDNGITGWGNWNGKNKASYEDGNLVAEYVSTGNSGAITSPTFSLDTSKAKYIRDESQKSHKLYRNTRVLL